MTLEFLLLVVAVCDINLEFDANIVYVKIRSISTLV